ncbi:MAG TPA: CoA transferase [Methylomirabilota bacterium]|nr:CoA transferase [Methylomirabilota bacterium]
MTDNRHVLDGIRVLDVGSFIAAPSACTVLGDFGAEVIKVEPLTGDPHRRLRYLPGFPVTEHDYLWILEGRNKKSLAVDLKQPDGRAILLRLAGRADVFVTNLPPPVLARLRITWGDLAPVNARLIYAQLTGYGEVGEEAGKPGYDINAWWARSGLMDLVRSAGCPPARSMPGMGDHPTGMALFGAIMLALYQRERTGRGGKVSTSLMANGAWANSSLLQAVLCGGAIPEREPREQCRNGLINLYQCRDGRWFILTVLREDKDWPRFCTAIDRPDLHADPRFAKTEDRHANSVALVQLLDAVFATRDWADWRSAFDANGIPVAAINRVEDLRDDSQMTVTDTIVPLDGAPGLRTVTSPIQLGGQTKVPPGKAPEVGQHTEEVLEAAGYDAAAIADLRRRGVVG